MGEFTMPSLGADMEAGTVTQWLVKPGDHVHRGDIVAVVETEKSTIEVEIFQDGVISDLVVPVGEQVPVGTVLAHVTAAAPVGAAVTAAAPVAAAVTPSVVPEAPPVAVGAPLLFSPVVRHLAEELGVDLTTLEGTGPGGAITRADVEAAGAAAGAAAVPAPLPAEVPRRRTGRAGRRPKAKAPAAPARKPPARKPPSEAPPPAAWPSPGGPARPGAWAPSSPLARRLAAELGVELSGLVGTGPHGAVVERDVRVAAAAGTTPTAPPAVPAAPAAAPTAPPAVPAAPAAPTVAGADRQAMLRKAIGALMARSKREIPHYYLSTTIDVGTALAWLERENLERPITGRLVLPVLLLKATARAVAKVPEMNGFFVDDEFAPSEAVHVGVAVSLRAGGVMAPAIHDTDRLSLDELMAKLHDLVGRARTGVVRSSEMSDPTITVTNLGDLGVESVFGVIYPPQVALVGFGRVVERPWASGGLLGVRPCVAATLSADHRVSDGHRGGRFLAEIDRLLQEPEKL